MGTLPPLSEEAWVETFEKYQQYPEYQRINRGMPLADFKEIMPFFDASTRTKMTSPSTMGSNARAARVLLLEPEFPNISTLGHSTAPFIGRLPIAFSFHLTLAPTPLLPLRRVWSFLHLFSRAQIHISPRPE